jgi:1,2-diacylglycerol 3-alpha-glucosyltransferase
MRIGIFTDTYPPYINGVSTSISMLKKALEGQGHEVFVVTINNESLNYKYEDNGKIIRIPGLPIGLYDYRISGIYPIRAVNRIKKWKLDVIHSHTEFSMGTFARIIAKQLNIPLVHTYHTMYEDYIHYITKGYFNGISKKIVEYFTLFYCDKTISELVVVSQKAYDLFKEKYQVDRNIYIVPTGMEIERFYRENFDKKKVLDLKHELGIEKDDLVLLYVGRVAHEKDIDLLIDAQKSLIGIHKNIKLIIVGDGPDMDSLKKRTSHKSYYNSVIYTGKIPWVNVCNYYQLADIFVTASRSETQGLTVIEGLAASLAVVCADDPSFRNTVVNDLNGYLFKNKRQYKNCILKLYQDRDELNRMKKQARISSNEHSLKGYADKMLNVYNIAISNHKNKKPSNFFDRIRKIFGGLNEKDRHS